MMSNRPRSDMNCLMRCWMLYVTGLSVTGLFAATSLAQSPNVSLKNEIERAVERGADWLTKNQQEKGAWSTTEHPAFTALALVALQGKASVDAEERAALKKGYAFLLENVHEDGTIHGGKGLVNYNTS